MFDDLHNKVCDLFVVVVVCIVLLLLIIIDIIIIMIMNYYYYYYDYVRVVGKRLAKLCTVLFEIHSLKSLYYMI